MAPKWASRASVHKLNHACPEHKHAAHRLSLPSKSGASSAAHAQPIAGTYMLLLSRFGLTCRCGPMGANGLITNCSQACGSTTWQHWLTLSASVMPRLHMPGTAKESTRHARHTCWISHLLQTQAALPCRHVIQQLKPRGYTNMAPYCTVKLPRFL